jgi:predicted nucleotidyltransferase
MRKTSPIDALFPKVRQNILAATFSQPEKWWFMSELASFINTTPSSLQRELLALVESGILRSRRDGNRLYYQAESESPIFASLKELLAQTLGITQSLKESLLPLAKKIKCAFIYGSLARGQEHTLSDVDLIVIGSVGLAELSPILRESERKFNREINANCYSVAEFQKKVQTKNHFLSNILKQDKIMLLGENHELEQIAGESDSAETYDKPPGNRKLTRTR